MADYKTAIVGPKAVISGFKALGVTPFDAETGKEALAALEQIKAKTTDEARERYATVILIESLAAQIDAEDMEKVSRGALPAIVLLPGIEGSTGAGISKLQALAERAIGSDIFG